MKKSFFGILMPCFLMLACSKDQNFLNQQQNAQHSLEFTSKHQTQKSMNSVDYELKDGRIVLASQTDFEHFIWALESLDLDKWQKSIGFESYRTIQKIDKILVSEALSNSKEVPLLYNMQILSALNQYGIIQVNPYIFKLDFNSKKVFVLEADKQDHLAHLESATSASDLIREFSFNDDVWYLLDNNLTPEMDQIENYKQVSLKCNDKKSKNKSVLSEGVVCSCAPTYWEKIWIKVWYNKFGIWEDVNAVFANGYFNVYATASNEFIEANLLAGQISYHLEERCGPVFDGVIDLPHGQFDNEVYLVHSSTKPLKRNASNVFMSVYCSYIHAPNDPAQIILAQLDNF